MCEKKEAPGKGAMFACGEQSMKFPTPVFIRSSAAVVGKKEGEGPLGGLFDLVGEDDLFGCNTWEEAESSLQRDALHLALKKAGMNSTDLRCLFAGDLLGQSIATSFGLAQYERPVMGLYGACSASGLALSLGAMAICGGFADCVGCVTSSHFASAEKEFRFPLGYGNQRPLSATWTVTASGAFILTGDPGKGARGIITGITPGKIVDFGLKDSMNMGPAWRRQRRTALPPIWRISGADRKITTALLRGIWEKWGRGPFWIFCWKRRSIFPVSIWTAGSRFMTGKSRTPMPAVRAAAVLRPCCRPMSSKKWKKEAGGGSCLSPREPCCPRPVSTKAKTSRESPTAW